MGQKLSDEQIAVIDVMVWGVTKDKAFNYITDKDFVELAELLDKIIRKVRDIAKRNPTKAYTLFRQSIVCTFRIIPDITREIFINDVLTQHTTQSMRKK